jgi:uncharacterized damage-inducible protein DinB
MSAETHLRELLARLLAWEDAHVGFEAAVADIPVAARGTAPAGLPHSLWQLLDHLRRTQHDILDFCVNPQYEELRWPDDYWAPSPVPPSEAAWEESVRQFQEDRSALQRLAADTAFDLAATIPHGSGQTYARELVLAADHAAYHVGQMILVRRALGMWGQK